MTLSDFSNPELVNENVYNLFGPNMILLPSTRKDKTIQKLANNELRRSQ